jgi:hypothetical protein
VFEKKKPAPDKSEDDKKPAPTPDLHVAGEQPQYQQPVYDRKRDRAARRAARLAAEEKGKGK